MNKRQEYELLRINLLWLKAEDIVTASDFGGNDDAGEESGTKLPPIFE